MADGKAGIPAIGEAGLGIDRAERGIEVIGIRAEGRVIVARISAAVGHAEGKVFTLRPFDSQRAALLLVALEWSIVAGAVVAEAGEPRKRPAAALRGDMATKRAKGAGLGPQAGGWVPFPAGGFQPDHSADRFAAVDRGLR